MIKNKNREPRQLTKANDSEFLADAYDNLMVYITESRNAKDVYIMKYEL